MKKLVNRTLRALVLMLGACLCVGPTLADRGQLVESTLVPVQRSSGPGQSVGLFIGVNDFADNSGLSPLSYAVDDAVAQAYMFVHQLQLLPA